MESAKPHTVVRWSEYNAAIKGDRGLEPCCHNASGLWYAPAQLLEFAHPTSMVC